MDNAFAPPEIDEAAGWPDDEEADRNTLPFERLKKLYLRSCNVTGIAFFMLLGAAASILLPATLPKDMNGFGQTYQSALAAFGAFCLVAFVGTLMRARWGRITGIIFCALLLIRIPIGTIVGVIGLFAFIGAPELFGPNRRRHGDLKRAYKAAKRERKLARRGLA